MQCHLAGTLLLSTTLVMLPQGTWSGIAGHGSGGLIPGGVWPHSLVRPGAETCGFVSRLTVQPALMAQLPAEKHSVPRRKEQTCELAVAAVAGRGGQAVTGGLWAFAIPGIGLYQLDRNVYQQSRVGWGGGHSFPGGAKLTLWCLHSRQMGIHGREWDLGFGV